MIENTMLEQGIARRGSCERAWREVHAKIGARLRDAREAAGATQDEVAASMGCTGRYVSLLEAGQRDWTLPRIAAYRSALEG